MLDKSLKCILLGSAIGFSVFFTFNKDKVFADYNKPIHVDFQEHYGGNASGKVNLSKYGFPQRSASVNYYSNHALGYDNERRIPHWVLELLEKANSNGTEANRKNSGGFKVDPFLHPMFTSSNEDYKRSGWSRGHMAAAGNHKHSQSAMDDTFFLSNIVPQDIENNSGYWNRLEIYTRDLLHKYQKIWVLTGPLFLAVRENGKMMMKYQVIGASEVAVPTHLFKVLLVEGGERQLLAAFVVPNEDIPKEKKLLEHQVAFVRLFGMVPLEFVEKKSGLVLFPNLDRNAVGDLCKVEGCGLKPWEEVELYFLTNETKNANSLEDLEKALSKVAAKGLKPDKKLLQTYHARKKQLEQREDQRRLAGRS